MENKYSYTGHLSGPANSALEKFITAQHHSYRTALEEIGKGKKQSHWMWYIFPQIRGLGHSETSQYYAIKDLEQAASYLHHPLLGKRLIEISGELLNQSNLSAHDIFGSPDELKLRSSMTLFSCVGGTPSIFEQVLQRFFEGTKDIRTLKILGL